MSGIDCWEVRKFATGTLCAYGLEFGHSKSYLCVCSKEQVRTFNTENGRLLSSFGESLPGTFVQILRHPKIGFQLYTLSDDGIIRVWNYYDGVLLQTIELDGVTVDHFGFHPTNPSKLILAHRSVGDGSSSTIAEIYDTKTKLMTPLPSLERYSGMAMAPGVPVLVVYSAREVAFIDLADEAHTSTTCRHEFADISTVAVSPTNSCVAVGDMRGSMTLYYFKNEDGLLLAESDVVKTTAHWHAHSINTLAFTGNGHYVLSGGQEGVLVLWHAQTLNKTFLPRLGGAVSQVVLSGDSLYSAVSLKDCSVKVIELNGFRLVSHIENMYCQPGARVTAANSIFAFDPREELLVVAGSRGSLQFWQPQTLSVKASMSISPHNSKLSGIGSKGSQEPLVLHVAFSKSSNWMVTLDVRHNHRFSSEVFLKFWQYCKEQNTYRLHTRVDYPHGRSKITSLAVSQNSDEFPLVVSTGRDNSFKLWSLREDAWQCDSVGSFRGLTSESAQFSWDHSLLATAFGNCVTLWQPETCRLVQTLCVGSAKSATVKQVAFVPNTSLLLSVILYGKSAETNVHYEVVVWDLLSCNCIWSTSCEVRPVLALVASNSSVIPQFLLFKPCRNSNSTHVQLVRISPSRAPVAAFSQTLPYVVVHAICDTKFPPSFWIYTEDGQLLYLKPLGDDSMVAEELPEEVAAAQSQQGIFSSLFGPSANDKRVKSNKLLEAKTVKSSLLSRDKVKELSFLQETASHVIPPLDTWCFQYWSALLKKSSP